MRPLFRVSSLALGLCLSLAAGPASATVRAEISKAAQRMRVYVDGALAYAWPVSTARKGFTTPVGRYRVGRMARMWHSRKYDNAPMPYAMFFRGGYAVHGTGAVSMLGRPASHGCVRLATGNARTLFNLAEQHGGASIVVTQ